MIKKTSKYFFKILIVIVCCLFTFGVTIMNENQVNAAETNTVKTDGNFTITIVKDKQSLKTAYLPSERNFAAMASVEVTGNRLWAAWMTGGDKEPHNDNYIVIAYSENQGKTWVDPYIIIDDLSSKRTRDPMLWYAPTGELYIFFGGNDGTRLIKIANPEAKIDSIQLTSVTSPFPGTIINKPIVKANGEWMCSTDPYIEKDGYKTGYAVVSTNQGVSWEVRGTLKSTADGKKYHEGTLVEKQDGSLWMLSRIELGAGGGVEESYSYDGGYNWTTYKAGLKDPLIGPGSKCAISKLQNGGLLFVSNNSTSDRIDLTAYYSIDDGETWSSLLLDSRNEGCAYPDIAQGSDGTIYVIWDYSRTHICEIRMAKFTIEDLLAGNFVSNIGCRPCVTKKSRFKDIVAAEMEYTRNIELDKGCGVTKQNVIDTLPTTVRYILDDGSKIDVTGTWNINWFSSDYAGLYKFKFTPTTSIDNIQDVNEYFVVKVKVVEEKIEEKNTGCGSNIGLCQLLFMSLGVCCIIKKK